MHSAGRGMSQLDVEQASAAFERLSRDAARHAIKFYEKRSKLSTKAMREAEDSPPLTADFVSPSAHADELGAGQ
jgi:hypothetical protein